MGDGNDEITEDLDDLIEVATVISTVSDAKLEQLGRDELLQHARNANDVIRRLLQWLPLPGD